MIARITGSNDGSIEILFQFSSDLTPSLELQKLPILFKLSKENVIKLEHSLILERPDIDLIEAIVRSFQNERDFKKYLIDRSIEFKRSFMILLAV